MEQHSAGSSDQQRPTLNKAEIDRLQGDQNEASRALDTCIDRIIGYASPYPAALTAAIRLRDGPKDYDGRCDIMEKLDACARQIKDAAVAKAIIDCLDVVDNAACMLEAIAGLLAGEPDHEHIEDDEVAALWDDVAALPPAVTPHRPAIEGLTALSAIHAGAEGFGTLVEGTANRGEMLLFYGLEGKGKTAFGLDFALCCATGRAWRGRTTRPGAVLFLASEAAAEAKARAYAWRTRHGVKDAPFAILDRAFDLTTEVGGTQLLAAVQGWQATTLQAVALVVIDVLAKCMGGADENAGAPMGNVVANLDRLRRETGAATLVIHHAGKAANAGPRGHGSLAADASTIIRVDRGLATVEKQRGGEGGQTFPFNIVPVTVGTAPDGQPITGALIEHTTAATPAARPPGVDPLPLLVTAIRAAEAAGQPFKLNRAGSLHERRATLPSPLCDMGRDRLQALAKAGIAAGSIRSAAGALVTGLVN